MQVTQVQTSFPIDIQQDDSFVAVELPTLSPEQESFIKQAFLNQQKITLCLAEELKKKEAERRRYQETMMRHAAALSYSIVEKFVETINKSPELQVMLGISRKNKEPLKLDGLMEKLEAILKEESPPDDKEIHEWIWCKRGIEELLEPVKNDINTFLETFGVENLKKHCPDLLEKDLEEQLRLALNPPPTGPTKLQMAGTGLKYTFWILYYLVGFAKDVAMTAGMGLLVWYNPSDRVITTLAKYLLKIVIH